MTAGIVGDTITEIMEKMNSLPDFGDKTKTITENIKRYLSTIKGVAEHSDAAKVTPHWLIDVTDAVSDLWDLLEAHRAPADAALLPKQSNITSFFSVSRCTPHWHRLRLQLEQMEERLQYIADDLTKLEITNCKRLANSDLQDREIEIVGRENDKEEIVRMILARGKAKGAVPVVTITGMKGMGKTTLAKFVCNDERMHRNFDLVIWIDGVHEELYAESVLKRMRNESAIMKKELEEKDSVVMEENLKTLVGIWMAEGFLGPVNSNSSSSLPPQSQPEHLGLDCIEEFCRRSILLVRTDQRLSVMTKSSMDSKFCSMGNKLMLELSTFVAGKGCFWMEDHGEIVKETVHRVSLTPSLDVTNGISKNIIENNKSLRTILFPMPYPQSSRIPYEVTLSWYACDAIFRAFRSLRVLNLSDLGIRMLPISIGELKSLRCLNLSHNNMKRLPNSVGKLKQLQALILSHCHQLSELPNAIKHLVSLRHLEMKECLHLKGMPSALKKLTNLLSLSNFVAKSTGKNHNRKQIRGLGELINLNNLRGELEISHLERLKFKESEQGTLTYLKEKQYLVNLTLKWNHDDDDNDNTNDHDEISLGHLEPHPNLQVLRIAGYRGTKFSNWLSSLQNLTGLTLYNCATCKSLPPLDQFPKLNVLELRRLDSLEYITDQDDDRIELGFELLKELAISDCPKLTSWWKGRTHNGTRFPSLSLLEVAYCPKLDSMPLYPDLFGRLVLEGSSVKPLMETISYTSARSSRMPSDLDSISNTSSPLSKLFKLTIKNVEEQSPLPEDWLKNFMSLQYLWISGKMSLIKGFKHLSSLHTMSITKCTGVDLPGEGWEGLQSLRTLNIDVVVKLESLPEGIQDLKTLTSLTIRSCPELKSLTEGIGHLTSLTFLLIEDCHKLALLPKGMKSLTSLNKLRIKNCPLLLPRCQKETGDDWPQIQHIKDIQLTGISEVYE